MTKISCKNSDLNVCSRIIKNYCAENSVNESKQVRTLLRTLMTGIKITNPLLKNLSKLLRKIIGFYAGNILYVIMIVEEGVVGRGMCNFITRTEIRCIRVFLQKDEWDIF